MKTGLVLAAEAKAKIQELTVQQLAALVQSSQVRIIDVREPAEFAGGHIPGAVNMPRGVLEMQLPQHPAVAQHSDAVTALTELATQPLYLICRSGARSALAAESLLMKKSGFVGVNKKTVLWVSHIIYASVSIICILASVEIMDLY